jgi:hypothetical protein
MVIVGDIKQDTRTATEARPSPHCGALGRTPTPFQHLENRLGAGPLPVGFVAGNNAVHHPQTLRQRFCLRDSYVLIGMPQTFPNLRLSGDIDCRSRRNSSNVTGMLLNRDDESPFSSREDYPLVLDPLIFLWCAAFFFFFEVSLLAAWPSDTPFALCELRFVSVPCPMALSARVSMTFAVIVPIAEPTFLATVSTTVSIAERSLSSRGASCFASELFTNASPHFLEVPLYPSFGRIPNVWI